MGLDETDPARRRMSGSAALSCGHARDGFDKAASHSARESAAHLDVRADKPGHEFFDILSPVVKGGAQPGHPLSRAFLWTWTSRPESCDTDSMADTKHTTDTELDDCLRPMRPGETAPAEHEAWIKSTIEERMRTKAAGEASLYRP